MTAAVKTWRYDVPAGVIDGSHHDGAVVVIDERGLFMTYGNYGAHGYYWPSHACRDVREFIAKIADATHYDGYMLGKLAAGYRIWDGDGTKAALATLLESMREGNDSVWTIDDVNSVLAEVEDDFEDFDTEFAFIRWVDESTWADQLGYELVTQCHRRQFDHDVRAWMKFVAPKLSAMLRAELESEGYFAQQVSP